MSPREALVSERLAVNTLAAPAIVAHEVAGDEIHALQNLEDLAALVVHWLPAAPGFTIFSGTKTSEIFSGTRTGVREKLEDNTATFVGADHDVQVHARI